MSMENEEFLDGDFICLSDFEDDMESFVRVEAFLSGVHMDGGISPSILSFEETYVHNAHSNEGQRCEGMWEEGNDDDKEEFEDIREDWEEDERGMHEGRWEDIGDEHGYSVIDDIPHVVEEPSLPFFQHVHIATFPKHVHFIHCSIELMIECLEGGFFPTYMQIHEAHAEFMPLLQDHGRPTIAKIHFHTIQRWEQLQGKLMVVQTSDSKGLSPKDDKKNSLTPPVESWPSIVQQAHISSNGNYLLINPTRNSIRKQWSSDLWMGGILNPI